MMVNCIEILTLPMLAISYKHYACRLIFEWCWVLNGLDIRTRLDMRVSCQENYNNYVTLQLNCCKDLKKSILHKSCFIHTHLCDSTMSVCRQYLFLCGNIIIESLIIGIPDVTRTVVCLPVAWKQVVLLFGCYY